MSNNSQVDSEMTDVFDTLLTVDRTARMREDTFARDFLPFLNPNPMPKEDVAAILEAMSRQTGRHHTEADMRTNIINRWLELVGSPYKPCEVYSSDNELLYTVPPLFTRSELIPSDKVYELPRLVEQAGLRSEVLETLGNKYVRDHIDPLFSDPTAPDRFVQQWNSILKHYDLPLIGSVGTLDSTDEENDDDNDQEESYSDIFDYD